MVLTGQLLAGSNHASPLQPVHQGTRGFCSLAVTVVFAPCAPALQIALVTAGRLSTTSGGARSRRSHC